MARRAKSPAPRKVRCYRCTHAQEVSPETMSTSCPGCHTNIVVEDLVLKKNRPKLVMVTELGTCGKVVVPKGARLVAETVAAGDGVEVKGHLEAKEVTSERGVVIGKKAYWRGALRARTLVVEATAVIDRAFFDVAGHTPEGPDG